MKIYKQTLENGLAVIVLPQNHATNVAIQLWYNVGSKHENVTHERGTHECVTDESFVSRPTLREDMGHGRGGERGLAHLLEHMVFKGTAALSESDINLITHRLSGSCNAFTSHDYTGYEFTLPVHHWHHALPVLADCMVNCTFKDDLLNAEVKAVVQELKMYNDDYLSVLLEQLLDKVFHDHPYSEPVIGSKEDLLQINRKALVDFYKRHYVPNNAHLVVVGPVDADDVFSKATQAFGSTPSRPVNHETFTHSANPTRQAVTLYRDVQHPQVIVAWEVPGVRTKKDGVIDMVSWMLGEGKNARLVKRLVDTEELVTSIESFVYDLNEYSLFGIHFQPRNINDTDTIIESINEEIAHLVAHDWPSSKNSSHEITGNDVTGNEVTRAYKKMKMAFMQSLEDNEKTAYILGKYYSAHGDEQYLLSYAHDKDALADEARKCAATYLRPMMMHTASLLPFTAQEKAHWLQAQQQEERKDSHMLAAKERKTPIEEGKYVNKLVCSDAPDFTYAHAESLTLSNGLNVLYYFNPHFDKIDMVLDLQGRVCHEPDVQAGIYTFLMDALLEGTQTYPGHAFMQQLETHGMSLSTLPGCISMSMLSSDFAKGLAYLSSMLREPELSERACAKIRRQLLVDITDFWDNPMQFIGQLARQIVYKNHPYSKTHLGTVAGITSLESADIRTYYEKMITPRGATLVVVGNLKSWDVKALLEDSLGAWKGNEVGEVVYPALSATPSCQLDYPINRDQIILGYAGLSRSRTHDDYDRILLFDHVLMGGSQGSMASRLFQIREETGIFYTAGGSLLTYAHKEPGMFFLKAIVSRDRLSQAEKLLENLLAQKATVLTRDEIEQAKKVIIHAIQNHFSTNKGIAAALLFLQKFGFGSTFFQKRVARLNTITTVDVQKAVERLIDTQHMAKIRIGRV